MNWPVTDKKRDELLARMRDLEINESDLNESFIQGGGKGGQKVNKSASCVTLKHVPTGINIKCQKERTRALNRFFARRLLCDAIEQQKTGHVQKKDILAEKIKKQKARRKRRSKKKAAE